MQAIRLFIYHTNEDDPKKCSAKKLEKFKYATLEKQMRRLPSHLLLLDPYAEKSLSPEDIEYAGAHGLLAIDCSWKSAESTFHRLEHHHVPRALPFVVAANPVNYGKAFKLTTLEALATALYILNDTDQAKRLLSLYKWGPHFLTLNKEPLEDYRTSQTSTELIRKMNQYL